MGREKRVEGGRREREREQRNRTRLEFGWIYQVLIIRIQHDMERGDQERWKGRK